MGKRVDVSLDIEACGEVVVSIGACVFDIESAAIVSEFYAVPRISDQLGAGMKMDAGAFEWWLKQSDAARRAVTDAPLKESVADALDRLLAWMPKDCWLWAYPTSFDLPLVARLCERFNRRCPWTWTRTMDGRTLWRIALERNPHLEKIEAEAGVEHDALADAKQQAGWFVAYWKAIKP